MIDGSELTNGVAGAVERTNEQIAALLDDAAYYRRAGFPAEAAWREQRAADLRTLLAIAADHARLAQATGEAKSALERVATWINNHVPAGTYAATTMLTKTRTALSLLQEGEAGGAG